jgi:glutamine synthetase
MAKQIDSFALQNPVSLATGKSKEDFTREDMINIIQERKIERITFHYTAIDGKIREMRIPIANRRQAELVLAEGERVDGSSLFKGFVDVGKSDLYVVPIYKSAFFNPFDSGSLDFMCCYMNKDGELADYTPDNILRRAAALLRKNTGLEFHALSELEFYLIGNFENNIYPQESQRGYHATSPYIKGAYMLDEMLRYITQITGCVKYAHNEVGHIENIKSNFEMINGKSAEQKEIEFLLAPVDEMADHIIISSWIIRNVAYKYGFIATFFPKIEVGHAGNGLHFHTALYKNGKNIMTDQNGDLTEEATMLIGGLCQYAPSLTAFGNTTPASYLRLVPGQEAPTKVCWSEMNRSAMIRVPLAWTKINNLASKINPQQTDKIDSSESRQTVELRSPDGSANAHLLLSGITLAADWGLTNKEQSLDLAKKSHVSVNIHGSSLEQELPNLAQSCVESSEKILQDRSLYERNNIFPPKVISYVAKSLQKENDQYLNSRLMSLDEEERSYQYRRMMHRDLHKY